MELSVRSVPETIKALSVLLPGFKKELTKEGRAYRVLVDNTEMSQALLSNNPLGVKSVVDIVPIIQGAKSELITVVVGAALFMTGQWWAAGLIEAGVAGATAATFAAGTLSSIGVGMVTSGLYSLLYTPDENLEIADNASNVFNGPVNTVAQGNPVPIGYGRLRIGSAVISSGIERDQGFTALVGIVAGSEA